MNTGEWFQIDDHSVAFVSWWPKNRSLHYPKLYRGIYEYLREPPEIKHLDRAKKYLSELLDYPYAPMQRDRIAWTEEWIANVPDQRG